jgi:anti-sigma regulatory factor (Ser/Thr protein kinase)
MPSQTVIPVADVSQIGEARRIVARLSSKAAIHPTAQGKLAIIVTELATNLVRHARQGTLLYQELTLQTGPAIEIIAIDSGPGITDVHQAMSDGFSTAGTAGNGLGAVKRLSDEFDIFSQPRGGTVIVSRVFNAAAEPGPRSVLSWGAISIAAPNETACGDSWCLSTGDGQLSLMVADGLGHGPDASVAAEAAVSVFIEAPRILPDLFLQKAHRSLSGTRGAAVAMACVMLTDGLLKFSGVGNISGTLSAGTTRKGLCSHNGTVGVQLRKVQRFDYEFRSRDLLILHTDGLQTRWSLDDYPDLAERHPAIIAAVLYRDFERGRDDLTVVVVRLCSFKA